MESLPTKTENNNLRRMDELSTGALVRRPTLGSLIKVHLADVPVLLPVEKPDFSPSHAKAPFMTRLGAATIYVTQSMEYSLSPSGTLRAFIKLFLKWFITLALLVCVVGGIFLIAASFLESVGNLLMLAMQHLFYSVLYLLGTVLLIAFLVTGIVMLLKMKKTE